MSYMELYFAIKLFFLGVGFAYVVLMIAFAVLLRYWR
jgi:hypothetical protein